MAAVIIRSKDVERLGKKLVKEVYNFLHNEYYLTNFPEIKIQQKKFLRNLVIKKFRYFNVTTINKPGSIKLRYEKFDENKFDEELKCVKEEIQNGTLNTYVINETLLDLDLDSEIEEDLFYKIEAFLRIYEVFENDHTYLE